MTIRRFKIEGDSMVPAFRTGERVVAISRGRYKEGDAVLAKDPRDGRIVLKRIFAMRDGNYMLLGDNQEESTDSRTFGSVSRSQIVGKVLLTY